jgi:hypothetical protein
MKNFIICTNSLPSSVGVTVIQRNQITLYLQGRGLPVWHWIEDVWLVIGSDADTPRSLREDITRLIGEQRYVLVMQVEPVAHSGMGNANGWPWMAENWSEPE